MLKSLLRDRLLCTLLVTAILLRLFALDPQRVEAWYARGSYPGISIFLRAAFGWIPFSMGDLLYAGTFLYFVVKAWKVIRLLAKRVLKQYLSHVLLRKYIRLSLWIYILFHLFWGLNYDRIGIAGQLGLQPAAYHEKELTVLAGTLQQRLCTYADKVDSMRRLQLDRNSILFEGGLSAYHLAKEKFPFLEYRRPSLKPSLLTPLGHYFGFTGYYNPFTAEAQLKTTIPVFLKPFVLCHEMGHQLGYAKENEANFVGFLAARASADPEFRYSAYFEMYLYTLRELARFNPVRARNLRLAMHQRYHIDRETYRKYLSRNRNAVEPVMTSFYDQYLKMNNQPSGMFSYNEVVQWLVAYGEQYGWEEI